MLSDGVSPISMLNVLFVAGAEWAEGNCNLAHATSAHVLRDAFHSNEAAAAVEGYGSLPSLTTRLISLAQAAGEVRNDIAANELGNIVALLHARTLWIGTAAHDGAPIRSQMEQLLRFCLEGMAPHRT